MHRRGHVNETSNRAGIVAAGFTMRDSVVHRGPALDTLQARRLNPKRRRA
jgi:hypothetical protein